MTIAATARLNSAFDNVASSAPHFLTLSAYRDEDPGYHKQGSGPAHTVFATALSQANTIKASPQSGVVDQGKANMVIGRDPGGALSVRQLSVQSVASRPLQHPTLLNSWRQFSVTNRSTIGFWVSGSSRLRFVARRTYHGDFATDGHVALRASTRSPKLWSTAYSYVHLTCGDASDEE